MYIEVQNPGYHSRQHLHRPEHSQDDKEVGNPF